MTCDTQFRADRDRAGWFIDCGLRRKARVTASGKINRVTKGITDAPAAMLEQLQRAAADFRDTHRTKNFGGPKSATRWAACRDIAARANKIAAREGADR